VIGRGMYDGQTRVKMLRKN